MPEAIGYRMKVVIDHYNMNINSFSKSIDMRDTPIRNVVNGKTKPSFDVIVKILKKYSDISPIWLLEGAGKMLKSEIQNGIATITQGEDLVKKSTRFEINVKDSGTKKGDLSTTQEKESKILVELVLVEGKLKQVNVID